MARALKPAWFIKNGRDDVQKYAALEVWQDFYVKLDFSDVAELSKLFLHELGMVDNQLLNSQT